MSILVLFADDFVLPAALEALWLADLPQRRHDALAAWPVERARHQSLIASRLLSHALQRLGHHGDHGDLLATLRYPPGSRPTLDLPVDFSLSHCDGRVLCAVSTSGPVGVDVEALGPLTAVDFPMYLNADERAWAAGDARRFYSIWTRKEAVVKAAGSRGLADVARVQTCAGDPCAEFAGQPWRTVEVPVGESYVAHLALSADPAPSPAITVEQVSVASLEGPLRLQSSPAS